MDDYGIRRGTTPEVTAVLDGDLSDLVLYVTFKQPNTAPIVKTGADLTVEVDDTGDAPETTIKTTLSQVETISLRAGVDVKVQVRGDKAGGAVAVATARGYIPVLDVDWDAELTDG